MGILIDSSMKSFAKIPMKHVGPIRLSGPDVEADVQVPLATLETPLWPSVARGARVTREAGGIRATVLSERMTRSVILEAPDAMSAAAAASALSERKTEMAKVVSETGRYVRLQDVWTETIGPLVFVRIAVSTGDAAGHNMVTRAAQAVLDWTGSVCSNLQTVSVSGNVCTDKKVSAVNGILGRGRHVVAEARISAELCRKRLRTEPATLAGLNVKKNLVGSILAGSVRSANAHFANMLLAFYLATGQDAANIVEGSQGLTYAEERDGDLCFSVSIPHLILGTVGAGKSGYAEENLAALGCRDDREPGANARRLAVIAAATVLCGELSLLAALANPGELMRTHLRMERSG